MCRENRRAADVLSQRLLQRRVLLRWCEVWGRVVGEKEKRAERLYSKALIRTTWRAWKLVSLAVNYVAVVVVAVILVTVAVAALLSLFVVIIVVVVSVSKHSSLFHTECGFKPRERVAGCDDVSSLVGEDMFSGMEESGQERAEGVLGEVCTGKKVSTKVWFLDVYIRLVIIINYQYI